MDTVAPAQAETDAPIAIAVLPFDDLSAAQDNAYFGDGVAEELLNALSQVEGLLVRPRTSSFALKDRGADLQEIVQTLDVDLVLQGSTRKEGTRYALGPS